MNGMKSTDIITDKQLYPNFERHKFGIWPRLRTKEIKVKSPHWKENLKKNQMESVKLNVIGDHSHGKK